VSAELGDTPLAAPARSVDATKHGYGRVGQITQITPRMRLIRLTGPELSGLSWTPGQHVRIRATDQHSTSALRAYSVWSYHRDQLELCVLDHGDGPGARWARWARGLRAGDEVLFRKPEGTFVVRDAAPYSLFAGEETASVAFGAMLGALPADAHVYGAIEVGAKDDCLPVPRSGELTWRFRGDASAAASPGLVSAVRDLELPAEPGVAYLAGEARTCQAVRKQLVTERGWPRRSVLIKPFWAPGKRGLE
jgi:NADPH-dependent ferric siderophore reductase